MKAALTNAAAIGAGGFLGALAMLRDDEYLRATMNVGTHVVLGLALVWAGYALAKWM